jgi:hypothetical protein
MLMTKSKPYRIIWLLLTVFEVILKAGSGDATSDAGAGRPIRAVASGRRRWREALGPPLQARLGIRLVEARDPAPAGGTMIGEWQEELAPPRPEPIR